MCRNLTHNKQQTPLLTRVVRADVDAHGGALAFARPALLHRARAVKVRQRQACALGSQVRVVELRVWLLVVLVLPVHEALEVQAAIHEALLHAEMVSRAQSLVARCAREAAQVVDGVASAHHHFRRRDAQVAARAPLHGEPSGTARTLFTTGSGTCPRANGVLN